MADRALFGTHRCRAFLQKFGGTAAVATVLGAAALNTAHAVEVDLQTPGQRRRSAYDVRGAAAQIGYELGARHHATNGDEERFPNKIGTYSKGLQHDSYGEVIPASYQSLIKAIGSGSQYDHERIVLGGPRKLTDPQAALAYELEGPDSHALVMPPPCVASPEEAGEMVEGYWMALLRDVPFTNRGGNPGIAAACADLDTLSVFKGPRNASGQIDPTTIFRGQSAYGDLGGPIISQFLWQDITYGAQSISQVSLYDAPGNDHMTDFAGWLAVQNGVNPPAVPLANRRYPSTMRDMGTWVHVDALYQGYLNACLILLGLNAPVNPGNPYVTSTTQAGFDTFGSPAILSLVCEVATRALKAQWFQKWNVHRRTRPEAFASLVHLTASGQRPYPVHHDVLDSSALPLIFSHNASINSAAGTGPGTYLLPMVFPEGSPTHPAYGSGHATVAGAGVTILKAWFDETWELPNPVTANADGSALVPYTGGTPLTVGGELNKVASNIGIARTMAGVHWRSDYWQAMLLGEKVEIGILREQKLTYNEPSALQFTGFEGQTITI